MPYHPNGWGVLGRQIINNKLQIFAGRIGEFFEELKNFLHNIVNPKIKLMTYLVLTTTIDFWCKYVSYLTTHKGLGKDKILVHTILCDKVLNRIHVMRVDSSIEIPHHSWSWINTVIIIIIIITSINCYSNGLLLATSINCSPFSSSSSSFASIFFWNSKRGVNYVQKLQAFNDFDGGIWRR